MPNYLFTYYNKLNPEVSCWNFKGIFMNGFIFLLYKDI